MDNLLCVKTLSHSPYDIFQSESSSENPVPFYDRETSSGMGNGVYFLICMYVMQKHFQCKKGAAK